MGTTSLGEEFWELEWQVEHGNLARDWVRSHPTTSFLPSLPTLDPVRLSPLREELGLRSRGKEGGSGPAEIDPGWQGPGWIGRASTLFGP